MTIGLTGGIACGKSTFRDLFCRIGDIPYFDADRHAKELLANDPGVRAAVTGIFGASAYGSDGQPDRAFLRTAIFHSPELRQRLEATIHPKVRSHWVPLAERARTTREHLLVDIPLLLETDGDAHCDKVVVVACAEFTQRERLAARGLSPEIARQILASQMPQTEKIARADFVIWNDGPMPLLEEQAIRLARSLF